MLTIIFLGCGICVAVSGTTMVMIQRKTIKKSLSKWIKKITRSETGVSSKEEPEEEKKKVETEQVDEDMDMEPQMLDCPMAIEYPVMDEKTGGRFVFVTIVRPPSKFQSQPGPGPATG